MTKQKHRALMWVGAILGVMIVAMAIFVVTFDWNTAKKYIVAGVSKATGRELKINGDLNVDLGWVSTVRASQIQFENARWSTRSQMLEVGLVEAEVDLWELLKWRVVLPTVTIAHAKMILEKNAAGEANWEFRMASAVIGPIPEQRTEFPVIEKLIVKDGTILFANQATKTQLELQLTQAEATGFLEAPVTLKAEGTYQQQPLTLSKDPHGVVLKDVQTPSGSKTVAGKQDTAQTTRSRAAKKSHGAVPTTPKAKSGEPEWRLARAARQLWCKND